ncbi:MAG: tubulin-like doman-containing protein [Candidatus Eisenbacteria bacterium]
MNETGTTKDKTRKAPAVIIGLGGTGAEVLLRVRRKFFEASATLSLEEFPIVRYLYLDTDEADKQIARYNQHLFNFKQSEQFMTTIDHWASFTHQLQDFSTLRKWWYEDQVDLLQPALNAGAGQMRAYGRLAFWHHAAAIRNAVGSAIDSAKSPASRKKMTDQGFTVTSERTEIYLVCSVAGGTGGGMLFDMGYLLRDISKGKLSINAFIVLPSSFLGIPEVKEEKVKANGYAALKELEYYCSRGLRKSVFDDKWQDNRPTSPIFQTSPFDRIFLFDANNEGNQSLAEHVARGGLTDMIADNIYLDYGLSKFAEEKRSVYVNHDQFLQGEYPWIHHDPVSGKDVLTEVWIKAFQSLGIAKIYVPIHRIKKACACRLWSKVFNLLGAGEFEGDVAKIRDGLLAKGDVPAHVGRRRIDERERKVDDFRAHLEKSTSEGKSLERVISERVLEIQMSIQRGDAEKESEERHEFLERKIKGLYDRLFVEPSKSKKDYQEWGEVFRQIELNRRNYEKELEKSLRKLTDNLMSDAEKGIGYASEVLRSFHSYFTHETHGYCHVFEDRIKSAEKFVEAASREYQARVLALQQHEAWGVMDGPFLKGSTIRYDIKMAGKAANDYFQAIFDRRILEASKEICEAMVEVIGESDKAEWTGLLGNLQKLKMNLDALADGMAIRERQFSEKEHDPVNRCIYEEEQLRDRYFPMALGLKKEDWKNKKVIEGACRDMAPRLLMDLEVTIDEVVRHGIKVKEIPEVADALGLDDFQIALISQSLRHFSKLDEVNVIDVFLEDVPAADQGGMIEELLDLALPWFQKDAQHVGSPEITSTVVGCHRENKPSHQAWWAQTSQSVKAKFPKLTEREMAEKDTIIFFSQMTGFPLCYGSSVRDLRTHYEELVRGDHDRLHISKDEIKYPDLVKLDEQAWMKLRRAKELFILGIATGVIRERKEPVAGTESQRTMYFYEYMEFGEKFQKDIGTVNTVIRQLIADMNLAEAVQTNLEERLSILNANPKAKAELGIVIRGYIVPGGVFAERTSTDGSEKPRTVQPMEYLIVRELINRYWKGVDWDSIEYEEAEKSIAERTELREGGLRALKSA